VDVKKRSNMVDSSSAGAINPPCLRIQSFKLIGVMNLVFLVPIDQKVFPHWIKV
jgi:hypothetical protein